MFSIGVQKAALFPITSAGAEAIAWCSPQPGLSTSRAHRFFLTRTAQCCDHLLPAPCRAAQSRGELESLLRGLRTSNSSAKPFPTQLGLQQPLNRELPWVLPTATLLFPSPKKSKHFCGCSLLYLDLLLCPSLILTWRKFWIYIRQV